MTTIGLIKGETRNLDYSSYYESRILRVPELLLEHLAVSSMCFNSNVASAVF